jgi:hypothetical protein
MSQSWEGYLDELETALRELHRGAANIRFPSLDDLGPLPDELWERAEGLLRAVAAAAGPLRVMRAEAASRCRGRAASHRITTRGPVLKV